MTSKFTRAALQLLSITESIPWPSFVNELRPTATNYIVETSCTHLIQIAAFIVSDIQAYNLTQRQNQADSLRVNVAPQLQQFALALL
ncbi:hypothetical protein [Bradyrhizobium sp. CCGUVB23]|uniref:hypothetical protein n=1 Tax=Bradyrhizobium sp. CCGUVB23 TaxID=2949630 RepID=UPI0020B349B7|nr:hypothetical protein [Bradyrhizobium sp. CCGUVB23]MCP3460751.1 hypothetical protein [Bradyrhizobium sp. CCGUVB23]